MGDLKRLTKSAYPKKRGCNNPFATRVNKAPQVIRLEWRNLEGLVKADTSLSKLPPACIRHAWLDPPVTTTIEDTYQSV
jgi:hypothetical protein